MDWVNRMNSALDFIECNLTNDLDEKAVCSIMGCSFSAFQASFSQITGKSVSEYIRRRRLTCAAQDLLNTDNRIIDIALKYGYQSADAFRVAFKQLHGVTPSEARKMMLSLPSIAALIFPLRLKEWIKWTIRLLKKNRLK